jgi:hypothetical protein
MGKFGFFMIRSQNKKKITTTSRVSMVDLYTQKKKVDKVMEKYLDIFSSLTRVPLHCQVKHPIDMTPDKPLPNGTIYRRYQMIDTRTTPQGAHPSYLITLQEPNTTGTEEGWNLTTLH